MCNHGLSDQVKMEAPSSSENTKKVMVIGDGCVGKTCLVARVTEGKFINNYHVTIGGNTVTINMVHVNSEELEEDGTFCVWSSVVCVCTMCVLVDGNGFVLVVHFLC